MEFKPFPPILYSYDDIPETSTDEIYVLKQKRNNKTIEPLDDPQIEKFFFKKQLLNGKSKVRSSLWDIYREKKW